MLNFLRRAGLLKRGLLDGSTYLASSMICKGLSFLAMPLITAILAPSEYGRWALYATLLGFAAPLSGLMLRYHVARVYYRVSRPELARLIFNVLGVSAALSGLLFCVALALRWRLDTAFEIDTRHLLVLPVLCFFANVQELVTLIQRYEKRPWLYALFEIGSVGFTLTAALLVLSKVDPSWVGYLHGALAASIVVGLAGLTYLAASGHLIPALRPDLIRDALRVGLPMVPHAIGGSVIALSDRVILQQLLSSEAVGIYAVGYSLGMSLLLFAQAFNKAWAPWVYEQLSDDGKDSPALRAKKSRIVYYSYIYALGLGLAGLGLAGAGWGYVAWFLPESYAAAVDVLTWAAGAALFQGLYYAVFPYLTHVGRTGGYAIITLFSAALNVGGTLWLVSQKGIVGAAQATMLAYVFQFAALFVLSQRIYPMPWLRPRLGAQGARR
ncbi:MAG: oligosaccharide flippase family protein [Bdellovibrionales bacterium]|nr:oligosaccharide flippase family protein [Bdellovibrionales bacterium]